MPLLALFTGARMEELCQLYVSDVKRNEKQGIWYFDFNTEGGKTYKTQSSIRTTPLHNELIKCGFLDYVKAMESRKEKRLFPDIKLSSRGRFSDNFSTKVNRYIDAVGIDERGKDFHSFRHTIKTALRLANVEEQYIDALVGHENKSVGRTYGGFPPEVLNPHMQKLDYGLDLSHLYIDTAYPPNPSQEISKTHSTTENLFKEPAAKELMQAISLAEAFNRLGGRYFNEEWSDYRVCKDGRNYDLLSFIRRGHNKVRILPPVTADNLENTAYKKASDEELERQDLMLTYLIKGITSAHGIRCYYKPVGSATYYLMDVPTRNKLQHDLEGLISSTLAMDADGGQTINLNVLVSPDSLEAFMAENFDEATA